VNPSDRRRFLAAPELVVVDLALAAVAALERAIRVEHPTLGDFPSDDLLGIPRRAVRLLHAAERLARALAAYRRAVHLSLTRPLDDDPF
jgi:predicted signal transduction protein with EAL and GGDEF domain